MPSNLKNNSINGVRVGTMKKIAKFFFGSDFVGQQKSIKLDSVIVFVSEETEEWKVSAFVNFWKVRVEKVKIKKQ